MTHFLKTVGLTKLHESRARAWRALLVSLVMLGAFVLPNAAHAQSFLNFTGPPTLVSGTALTQGAQYRYANALPGIDVLVTLAQFNGALSPMVLLDDNATFPTRFQPVITCAGNAGARECYIRFDFAFVVAGTFTPTPIYGLVASAQDTDGNGVANGVRESVEYTGATSVTLGTPTTLSLGTANIGGTRYIQNASTDVQPGIGTGNQYESYARYTAGPVTGISIAGGNVIGTAGCNSAATECQRQNSYSFLPADSNVPAVTVRKISNGGVGTFSFTGNNGWVTQPVTTVTAGTAVTSQSEALLNVNVATTITESPPAGFSLQSITCTGLGAGTATPTISGTSGGSVLLSAAAAVSGNNIVCTFTNALVPSAGLVITKTDNKDATSTGGSNNYVVTLTNQGPSAANNAIVTDVVGAGLTCPPTNAVTCSVIGAGAVCPAGPLTIASLTTGVTVPTLPSAGALQFAYSCNVN
jgi:uncharacterized repeat protein (TIGR01451 family)